MYTEIEGIRIQYEIQGEGRPVLLLHGWGASIEAMRPIANAVAGLQMQAISLDFPGFGGSGAPPTPFGVPEYARITRGFIEQLGLNGADVVCHSFGGRVTIYLASEEPALFNRLVLVDAAGIRPKRGIRYYFRTYLYKAGKRFGKVRWIDELFHISEKQKQAGSEDYRALQSDIMRAVFVKTVNLDLTNRLPFIQNPTLLIWGTEDTATPPYMGKLMEQRIPDAGLVMLEGAGHYSYADQYPRFCAILRAFLAPDREETKEDAK